MDAPAATFDLGELVTLAARPVLAQAIAKRYMVYFDHIGPPSEVFGNVEAHLRSLHRAMYAGMDLLKRGTMVMLAKTEPSIDGLGVRFTLNVIASGELVPRDAVAAVLDRLDCKPGATAEARSKAKGKAATATATETATDSPQLTLEF